MVSQNLVLSLPMFCIKFISFPQRYTLGTSFTPFYLIFNAKSASQLCQFSKMGRLVLLNLRVYQHGLTQSNLCEYFSVYSKLFLFQGVRNINFLIFGKFSWLLSISRSLNRLEGLLASSVQYSWMVIAQWAVKIKMKRRRALCLSIIYVSYHKQIHLNLEHRSNTRINLDICQQNIKITQFQSSLIPQIPLLQLNYCPLIQLTMRIVGIGIDLVMNSRIQQILTKNYAQRFIKKFLHQHQLKRYLQMENEPQQIQFVASRWAVKQALAKAIGRKELVFNQVNIIKDRFGRPHVSIEGDDNQRLFLEMQISHCHISITHERDYTIGTAIIEEK